MNNRKNYSNTMQVNRIYKMDAIEGLKKLKDESVDLIITDPPYNIANSNKKTISQGRFISTQEAWGKWDTFHPFDYDLLIMQVISQAYRVLKPGGAMYMFTAQEQNGYFIRKAVQRGFTYRTQLAIFKKNPLPSFFKNTWRSGFEVCMYLTKGRRKTFNFLAQSEMINVFGIRGADKQTTHPTEKPLEMIKRIVAVCSNTGDLVIDPFMGSGTTAVACKAMGRRFIGFENNQEYVVMARNRLKGGRHAKAVKKNPGVSKTTA